MKVFILTFKFLSINQILIYFNYLFLFKFELVKLFLIITKYKIHLSTNDVISFSFANINFIIQTKIYNDFKSLIMN